MAVVALSLTVTVAACSDESSQSGGSSAQSGDSLPPVEGKPPARPSGTLRVALAGQAPTLDPTAGVQGTDLPLMTAVYDGLLTRDPETFKLEPALATSWTSNADDSEWTFKLRKGVKFADGEPFNASAAKKSFDFYLRESSVWRSYIGPIAKVTAPNEDTVVISSDVPFPDLPGRMPFVKMISPNLLEGSTKEIEKRLSTKAVGTGAYTLESFSPAAGLVAQANPDYWGEGPHIARLELRPIAEESARNAALQAGDVDLVVGISPRAAQTFASNPQLSVSTVSSWTTQTMSVATQKTPLTDVRVRRALAYAIDREAIAKNVLLGQATVTGSVQPPGTYGYRKPTTQYTYDPEKSKALLKEAGVKTPVKLKLMSFNENPIAAPVTQAIAEQAKAGGFDLQVSQVPASVGGVDIDKPQRKYDLAVIQNGWINGGPFHLAAGLVTAHASYKGKKLLNMIEEMNALPAGPKLKKVIGDALEEEAKELPEIPLFAMKVSDASTSSLQNHVPPRDFVLQNWSEQFVNQSDSN